MKQFHTPTTGNQERIFQTKDTEKELKPTGAPFAREKKRTAKTNLIPFKQAPEKYLQGTFFPSNIFNLLPEDHECVIYKDILEQIDVTSLYKNYSVLGQNAYNPKLLLSILIYAYSQGLFSSRQIAEKLKLDIGYMYIGQMQKPNFRVLSDFRKDNRVRRGGFQRLF